MLLESVHPMVQWMTKLAEMLQAGLTGNLLMNNTEAVPGQRLSLRTPGKARKKSGFLGTADDLRPCKAAGG